MPGSELGGEGGARVRGGAGRGDAMGAPGHRWRLGRGRPALSSMGGGDSVHSVY